MELIGNVSPDPTSSTSHSLDHRFSSEPPHFLRPFKLTPQDAGIARRFTQTAEIIFIVNGNIVLFHHLHDTRRVLLTYFMLALGLLEIQDAVLVKET